MTIFTALDEPRRLSWLTVNDQGSALVGKSEFNVDQVDRDYTAPVLVKRSHRRLVTQNVLVPDRIVRAIGGEQRRDGR